MGKTIQEDRTYTKKQSSIFDDNDDYSDIPSFLEEDDRTQNEELFFVEMWGK